MSGDWGDLNSYGLLFALAVIIGVSGLIGVVAQRAVSRGSFLKGFFLGNRGLGVWAMALTATVQSGGTFMGVPSLIYSHGYVVALWIGSYMLVPLMGFAVVGKRLAHLSRRTDAVTVPDLFRGRFDSPAVGVTTSLVILFFLSFMLMAQFKAGALIMKLAWPSNTDLALSEDAALAPVAGAIDYGYLVGLAVFTIVVVAYTLFGGFLASVWTDLFQSVLMAVGVTILLFLALEASGGLEEATRSAVARTAARTGDPRTAVGLVTGPGYGRDFLPLGLACSYFVVWIWGGMSSPASIVRVMASKDTATLRRSIVVLGCYNLMIYLPLIAICICAHRILPPLQATDEVIPRLAIKLTQSFELGGFRYGTFVSGLILSAPFGAVMATVSCYLVVIASGIVRDVYQRFVNPEATDYEIRRMTRAAMIVVGAVALTANIWPPKFLQSFVVFCTQGQTGAFLAPLLMACYWRRATKQGVLAAMISGALTILSLYAVGWIGYGVAGWPDPGTSQATSFRPYFLLGFEPIVWGILVSTLFGVVVSLRTPPPDEALVRRMFDRLEPAADAATPNH